MAHNTANRAISVVFPAYNEEASLQETMRRALETLQDIFEDFEIIIVDDASTDRTGSLADALAGENPRIRVIHNETNKGQGESLCIGFHSTRCDLVVHNAVDYPFDLRDLRTMLPLLQDADVIVAVRKHRAGYTPYRRFTSRVNLTLINFLFGLGLRDYNFVQLYKKEVLDAVPMDIRSTAFLTPAMLIQAHDLGYHIQEVEVDYHPRSAGIATSGSLRVIVRSLSDMLRFRMKRTKLQRQEHRNRS